MPQMSVSARGASPMSRTEPEPCIVVIFGASGDLTHRKLMPALHDLQRAGLLPEACCIVGAARTDMSDDAFRDNARAGITEAGGVAGTELSRFLQRVFYVQAAGEDPVSLARLKERLDQLDQAWQTRGNRVFYLSVPPGAAPGIVRALAASGMTDTHAGAWRRVIIEKPFGRDLESARALNRQLSEDLAENQIYRIDHYLGKETVQNVLALRFANSLFEPLWNNRYVSHVQLTVAESLGIGSRAKYFEQAGILRDMVQNHMLQALSLIAMEPPADLTSRSIRDAKAQLLRSIRRYTPCDAVASSVRAQYAPGWIDGRMVPGYREEKGVSPDSVTESYVALRLWIDNWRWAGVPFYLRVGKRLPVRATEASIHFRPVPKVLFNADPDTTLEENALILRIQPNEGVNLRFGAKAPGAAMRIEPVSMDFRFAASFGDVAPDAYERLLLDVMQGDPTLYIRSDEIEAAWEAMTPFLEGWASCPNAPLPGYEAGSWGPAEAKALVGETCHAWRWL